MTSAVRVENLSKRFHISHAGQRVRYRTFRESLASLATAPVRRWRNGTADGPSGDFWAIKDVCFEVQPGEVIGIIGRNGAGKSTLLKILSRITRPTTGRVELHGRVGSLLEVGTGFHPELTGRENIFLNGSIIGMSRQEIARKFDEIVDFSGVEDFIDTPVKRYSSGMQVRLAFAVAAHLEPEILIVDEVLAVGDAEFQRKCLGQMEHIAQSGRTILFVSHNMAAIEGLCQRGALLDAGRLVFLGSQTEAIRRYFQIMESTLPRGYYRSPENGPNGAERPVHIQEVWIAADGESSTIGYPVGAPLEFRVHCTSPQKVTWPSLGIGIDDAMGQRIVTLHSEFGSCKRHSRSVLGDFEFVCQMSELALKPGDYRVKLSLEGESGPLYVLEEALTFSILPTDYYGNGGRFGRGMVLCRQAWELRG